MIDADFLDLFAPESQIALKKAFALLSDSGIILKQIEREGERVLSGNADESLEDMAVALRNYRHKTQALATLHQLGTEFSKEFTS